jgi:hypothetical protein
MAVLIETSLPVGPALTVYVSGKLVIVVPSVFWVGADQFT